jgi:hypothetical protein
VLWCTGSRVTEDTAASISSALSMEAAGSSASLLPAYQLCYIVCENTEICTCTVPCKTGIFTEVLLKILVCWDVTAVSTGN